MDYELMLNMEQITVMQGIVQFKGFQKLKEQALELATHIQQIEVNDDNLQTSKKLLAAVNKQVKELEDRRIKIKRLMLEPYQVFEEQVKEIVGVVKEADETVRQQVKMLEENEREMKKETLNNLFERRMNHYNFLRDFFHFKDFLQPKHLNKTTSIKQVEDEMVVFLEKLAKDIKVIETMPNAEALLGAYVDSKDLTAAISLVNDQERRKREIEASQLLKNDPVGIAYLVSISVGSQKELKFIEMLLKENEITNYSIDKIGGM
jgi:hypothetical protein